MLEKISNLSGLLLHLRKNRIVDEVYIREKIKQCKYYDITPLISNTIKNKYGIKKPLHIGGKGFNLLEAMNSCAGEVIERISIMKRFDTTKLTRLTFKLTEFFPKSELKHFNLPNVKMLPSVNCTDLLGRSNFLPVEIIIPNCYPRYLPRCTSSVGTAFAKESGKAIFSCIAELIERHSLLSFWYKNKKMPKLKTRPKKIVKLVQNIQKNLKISLTLYNSTTNIPCPVICCLIRLNKKEGVFGCAADPSVVIACKKAIAEALQLYISTQFISKNPKNILERYFLKLIKTSNKLFSNQTELTCYNSSKQKIYFYLKKNKIRVYLLDVTDKSFKKYGFVYRSYIPSFLHFSTKRGIVFNPNYYAAKKFNSKIVNPFI